MTKTELLTAIADAPGDAPIYIVPADGIGRSILDVEYEPPEQSDDGTAAIYIFERLTLD